MRHYVGDRTAWLAGLVREAQDRGELDASLPPDAVAHFCLSLAVGTALVTPDLHDVDDREWTELLIRVVTCLEPVHTGEQIGSRT